MKLVAIVLIPYFQRVMITSCHIPVKASEDSFVIIYQSLPTKLYRPKIIKTECRPCLIQYETSVFIYKRILSPHSYMLGRKSQ